MKKGSINPGRVLPLELVQYQELDHSIIVRQRIKEFDAAIAVCFEDGPSRPRPGLLCPQSWQSHGV